MLCEQICMNQNKSKMNESLKDLGLHVTSQIEHFKKSLEITQKFDVATKKWSSGLPNGEVIAWL